MAENGWRTLVIQSKSKLTYANDNLIVSHGEQKSSVPLSQIKILLLEHPAIELNVSLIEKLSEKNIKMIFCNKKHNPCAEVIGYSEHTLTAGNLTRQAEWKKSEKDKLWQMIVSNKVKNQQYLLKKYHLLNAEAVLNLLKSLKPGDTSNIEATAAKLYFSALFGSSFIRRTDNDINSALNYGYSIIQSQTNRCITMHGYHTAIGIHHHNETNPFNLTCDIMEPFRPFVDDYVYQHQKEEFNQDYRKALIALNTLEILYNGKHTQLQTAIDMYVLDCIKYMNKELHTIGKAEFL